MSEELELARQWMTKAANDLLNADNNLNAETIPLDTVCFHCQQAAEKLLKA
jgi:HEPN domain-containing protein